MLTPINTFKQALKRGETQIGLWHSLADPYAAEICAGSGFDYLTLDAEHAPTDLRHLLHTLQAVAPYSTHPVVRVPHGDPVFIKQVLEIGATTLIVPQVDSAEQAKGLVRAMRYPPHGIRGFGAALGRSSRWTRYTDYVKQADEQLCLIVQAETVTAIEHLEEIAAVEGVDGVMIGPGDLSASMGYAGQLSHPDVVGTINQAIKRIRATGKAAGILCADETLSRHYIEQGVTFAAVGVDTFLLAGSTKALADRFHAIVDKKEGSAA